MSQVKNVSNQQKKQQNVQKQQQEYVQYVINQLQQNRQISEQRIPKIPLKSEHAENCTALLNRELMLQQFGTGGNVAEIGVDEGKFSRLIHSINKPDCFHLIDIWGTDRFHDGKYESVKSFFSEQIEDRSVQIHKKLSIDAFADFEDEYFDWIYIDTDHSYNTTRDELRLYAPKMKKGGIMAGHDYVKGNWITTYRYGVIEAVHEFCVQFNWELIYLTIEPTENQSFAIRKI